MRLKWLNAIIRCRLRLGIRSEHERNIRAVNVTVQKPHFETLPCQCNGKIYCQRGFANAALARAHRNDGVNTRKWLGCGHSLSRRMGMRAQEFTIQCGVVQRLTNDYTDLAQSFCITANAHIKFKLPNTRRRRGTRRLSPTMIHRSPETQLTPQYLRVALIVRSDVRKFSRAALPRDRKH